MNCAEKVLITIYADIYILPKTIEYDEQVDYRTASFYKKFLPIGRQNSRIIREDRIELMLLR